MLYQDLLDEVKNHFPKELIKLEKISSEVRLSFNQLVDYKFSNNEIINSLKSNVKDILVKIR